MHVRGPHYIGIAPIADGGLPTSAWSRRRPRRASRDPAGLLERAAGGGSRARRARVGARACHRAVVLGPLAVDARAAGAPGLLLAGDAAGFIDPMTGDGLRFAIARRRARRGRAALAALDDPAIDAAARLAEARARAFGTKYGVNRLLRRLVGTPRRVSVMAISARVAPGILRQMIRYAGDVAA